MKKSYIKMFYQTNVLFIIMILVFSSLAAAENINPSVDVVYEGAFKVPYIDEFQRSGHGMTFYPKGDGGKGSLFISILCFIKTKWHTICIGVADRSTRPSCCVEN